MFLSSNTFFCLEPFSAPKRKTKDWCPPSVKLKLEEGQPISDLRPAPRGHHTHADEVSPHPRSGVFFLASRIHFFAQWIRIQSVSAAYRPRILADEASITPRPPTTPIRCLLASRIIFFAPWIRIESLSAKAFKSIK
jgi:hypothetical protein